LAVEVKNFAKVTQIIFNTTAVFVDEVNVSENDILEAGYCSCCACVGYLELWLQVVGLNCNYTVNQSQPMGNVDFVGVSCV